MSDKSFKIYETKMRVFSRDGWRCQVCGKPLSKYTPQLAHRIPQTKEYLDKYGEEIIHHDDNMVSTCSLLCNIKVNIGNMPEIVRQISDKIRNKLREEIDNG